MSQVYYYPSLGRVRSAPAQCVSHDAVFSEVGTWRAGALARSRGARSERDAKLAAHAIATSPLVKTALHGGDPNWGRILAAVGRSGARFSIRRVSLAAGPVTLVRDGQPTAYREKDAARVFSRDRVPIVLDLGGGTASAVVLSSDLGHDYVSLNADYRS